ncbi:MAG: hypothetical protein KIT79_10970 [Deltaproteobacteria bacterium]|nr:hypothetical protein [Deltaproteobacteria bacterium]
MRVIQPVRWRYIVEERPSASWSSAASAWLLERMNEGSQPVVRLYDFASPVCLLGRYQPADVEVDLAICQRNGVEIGRRLSGGKLLRLGPQAVGMAILVPPKKKGGRGRTPREWAERVSTEVIGVMNGAGLPVTAGERGQAVFVTKEGGRDIRYPVASFGILGTLPGGLLIETFIITRTATPSLSPNRRAEMESIGDFWGDPAAMPPALQSRLDTLDRPAFLSNLARALERILEGPPDARPWTGSEREAVQQMEREQFDCDNWRIGRSAPASVNGVVTALTRSGALRAAVEIREGRIWDIVVSGEFRLPEGTIENLHRALRGEAAQRDRVGRIVHRVLDPVPDGYSDLEPNEAIDVITLACERARPVPVPRGRE